MTEQNLYFPNSYLKDGEIMVFASSAINWNWYLEVRIHKPHGIATVEILKHYRLHKERDAVHPVPVGMYAILENSKRVACAVTLEFTTLLKKHTFALENPDHVFNYN